MSIPGPLNPPPARQTLRGGPLVRLIVGVLLASFVVWGVCAGFVLLVLPDVRSSLQKGKATALTATRGNPMDWWTARVLSEVYTRALDATTTHEEVIERLGEPVEIDLEAEDLYRRQGSEPLGQGDWTETIEFDLKGPQGKATVSVQSRGAPQSGEMMRIQKIEVTFDDASTIEVEPPAAEPFHVR
jgi:hypothetical protein